MMTQKWTINFRKFSEICGDRAFSELLRHRSFVVRRPVNQPFKRSSVPGPSRNGVDLRTIPVKHFAVMANDHLWARPKWRGLKGTKA